MLKFFSIIPVLSIALFGLSINSVKAAGPPDQSCVSDLTANTTMIRTVNNMTKQTFKPTFNRLSRVTIRIKGDGLGLLGMGIAKGNDILSWNIQGAMAEPNGNGQTISFEYNDLVLEPNQEYTLYPRISTDNNSLFWYYDYNCYDRGAAYIGAEVRDYDFDFATYGFTEEGPPVSALDLDEDEDQAVQPDGQATDPSTDQATAPIQTNILVDKAALATNITDAIKPPTNLKAVDTPNDQGGSITLTWERSVTEGVEGYTVFRQFDAMGDVYKISEVKSDVLKFVDTKATTGQQFFYFVRANKGKQQSNDSNKVSATAIANITASKTGPLSGESNLTIWYIAGGAGLAVIIAAGLFIYLRIKKKKQNINSINQNP